MQVRSQAACDLEGPEGSTLEELTLRELLEAGSMKIDQPEFRKEGKDLMVFGSRPSDGGSTEDWLVPKPHAARMEPPGPRIDV